MVLPVRFPPGPGEGKAAYLSRLARANDCTPNHIRSLIEAESEGPDAFSRQVSLLQLVQVPMRHNFGSPGHTRAMRRLFETAIVPNDEMWTCTDCEEHDVTAVRPATCLRFACTTHRRFLTPSGTADAESPPAEEFLLLQLRLNVALSDFALHPCSSHVVIAAIELIETLADWVEDIRLDSAAPLHDHARSICDLHSWARKPDAQTIGRVLRTVWPMVESIPMNYLTTTYIDQILNWHASHPDPDIRNHSFRPWELQTLLDTLGLGQQIATLVHSHGVTADHVPSMLLFEDDSFPLGHGVPRSAGVAWDLRTMACLIVFELVDDIELGHGLSKARDKSRKRRRDFNADFFRSHRNSQVLDTLPMIRRIIRALEPGNQAANIEGRLGIANRTFEQLLPRHRRTLVGTNLVDVWLWIHRAHGTEAMTTLPHESLPRLKKFDFSLSGEEKLGLLDFQDRLLVELSDRDSITPASHVTKVAAPSSKREAERA